jgi:signal transduction histidine kinase
LYRLIQEALLNVVRHGQTNEARVEIRREGNSVVAEVADFGRGFELAPTLARGALGLLGMYERATYVGGQVHVNTTPGHGTTVRIEIPVKEPGNG